MLFNVPQFIDIEDKIVGPLTAKQLGWLAMGGVIMLVLYGLLDKTTFIFSALIIALIFGGLAFYRPYNQPLISFITSSILFVTRPKMYIWKRIAEKETTNKQNQNATTPIIAKKSLNNKKINDLSKILDQK